MGGFTGGALRRIAGGLLAALALAAAPSPAQPLPSDEEVVARADAYMQSVVAVRGLGGSVLIARGDRILLSKGYGMADLEHGVANSPSTVFRIASVSKPFTAAAVLKLQERGLLSVDDFVCPRLAECSSKWSGVRIRHLLDHSSGIPDFMTQADILKSMRYPRAADAIAKHIGRLDLNFPPGTRTSYSNTNHQLLALLIDRHSGAPYDAHLKALVFDPLGMARTRPDHHDAIVADRARGYSWSAGGIVNAEFVEMRLHRGNGGLLSTTEDLFRWSRATARPGLLSQASLDAMATAPGGGEYGLGWAVGRLFDRKVLGHAGLLEGFSSQLSRFPDDDATVIVLMNDGRIGVPIPAPAVAARLSAILFGRERAAVALSEAALRDYPGDYRLSAMPFVISRLGSRLVGRRGTNPPDELLADAHGRLFMPIDGAELEFERDAGGRVTGFTLTLAGQAAGFARVN